MFLSEFLSRSMLFISRLWQSFCWLDYSSNVESLSIVMIRTHTNIGNTFCIAYGNGLDSIKLWFFQLLLYNGDSINYWSSCAPSNCCNFEFVHLFWREINGIARMIFQKLFWSHSGILFWLRFIWFVYGFSVYVWVCSMNTYPSWTGPIGCAAVLDSSLINALVIDSVAPKPPSCYKLVIC